MVVNKKKLKKQKKVTSVVVDRPISFKDIDQFQEYAHIAKVFGNGRFEATCVDGVTRLAHSRGNLKRKKVFVKLNDTVLVSLREFEDRKADILHVYTPKEVKKLISLQEIPATFENVTEARTDFEDLGFDCGGEDGDDEAENIEPKSPIDIDAI